MSRLLKINMRKNPSRLLVKVRLGKLWAGAGSQDQQEPPVCPSATITAHTDTLCWSRGTPSTQQCPAVPLQ